MQRLPQGAGGLGVYRISHANGVYVGEEMREQHKGN